MKFKKYLVEIIKGKSSWIGETEKGRKVEISQMKNGMYSGEIYDKYGDVESLCARHTKQDVDKWFSEHGIKKIKWEK